MTSNWFDFDLLQQPGPPTFARPPNGRRVPRQPFSESVIASKAGAAYNAHSYPTKIPPAVIEHYLNHYTHAGDVVLDPFCGSGMTGLAARRMGREALLSDLSPLAIHLAANHTTACDPAALLATWQRITTQLADDVAQLYWIACYNCHGDATIRYTIWSNIYRCSKCRRHVSLWDHGLDRQRGTVARWLTCPGCNNRWRRSAKTRVRTEPVWVAYCCYCTPSLQQRALTAAEKKRALSTDIAVTRFWYPTTPIAKDREMYKRCALNLQGIQTVADFYTPRNLAALATLWNAIGRVEERRVRLALAFAFTNTAWHGTKMRRFNARGGHRPLTGTLYIPQLISEANVFDVFRNKVSQLARFYRELGDCQQDGLIKGLRISSATDLNWLADESVDYVFTDPPFGSNIFYADCNFIAESWLGEFTNTVLEAVVNRSKEPREGGKTVEDYRALLHAAFEEMHRVLKRRHWATVVFQSTDGEIWSVIEEAASNAGFQLHTVNVIDKTQQSMKGYKGRSGAENVASFDVVMNLRKTGAAKASTRRRLSKVKMEEFVRQVVRGHLDTLPSEALAERTLPYLYSLAVRKLLNSRCSVAGLTMEGLRKCLLPGFEERHGRWYLSAEVARAVG